jgi:hypothetical protein
MNKEQIWGCLECCLLVSDGVNFDGLVNKYGFNPLIAEAGIKLFLFLQKKEINGGVLKNGN